MFEKKIYVYVIKTNKKSNFQGKISRVKKNNFHRKMNIIPDGEKHLSLLVKTNIITFTETETVICEGPCNS